MSDQPQRKPPWAKPRLVHVGKIGEAAGNPQRPVTDKAGGRLVKA